MNREYYDIIRISTLKKSLVRIVEMAEDMMDMSSRSVSVSDMEKYTYAAEVLVSLAQEINDEIEELLKLYKDYEEKKDDENYS